MLVQGSGAWRWSHWGVMTPSTTCIRIWPAACSGIDTNMATPAGSNMTTKGLAEIVDNLLTGAANTWTYGVENLAEVRSMQLNSSSGLM